MGVSDKFVKFLPEFFKVTLDEDNFEHVVFGVLNRIFDLKSGYVFFINSDDLTLKFSYNRGNLPQNISTEQFNEKFDGTNVSISEMCVEQIPFAKLVLVLKAPPAYDDMKEVFESSAAIVSNLVKDLEINSILKMQVEALRDGMNEVTAANKKILSAEKVKNEFFSNVSHQLRSPLNSIIGYADILESGFAGNLNEKQRDYISDIKISGIKLLEMVNEVLDMSKIESKSMTLFKRPFCLGINIREVLNILKPLYLQKNITVEVDIPEKLEITADYQKLQQVFFNIISNAVKFTPVDGMINISAKRDNDMAHISVEDNGIGIDKKYHKKIFKKFQQISPSDGASSGLGLTIALEIVKLHRGNIEIQSELNKGANFIISIPYC